MKKLKYQADVYDWITQAEEDLKWAEYNLKGGFFAQACFAAQQAAEKSLKAYLLSQEVKPPRIHSLIGLISECQKIETGFSQFTQAVRILDGYYAPTRYPDARRGEIYTLEKAKEAAQIADRVFSFVKMRLG